MLSEYLEIGKVSKELCRLVKEASSDQNRPESPIQNQNLF